MSLCSPQGTLLNITIRQGEETVGVETICGLRFDQDKVCGFFESDPSVGVQLCCARVGVGESANATLGFDAICEFTHGERIGQFIELLSSLFSAVAVSALLLYAAYRQLRKWGFRFRRRRVPELSEADVIDSSLFINLMVADLIQAVGNMPTFKWISQGYIDNNDPACTAQAALKQIGIVLTALTSLAISIQTFCVLVLRWRIRKSYSPWFIFGLWLCIALDIGIPNAVHRNADPPYYGSTGFWCWIYPKYKTEQIVTEYLWMWVSGFSMLILYGIMFAVMFGFIVVDTARDRGDRDELRKKQTSSASPDDLEADRESKAVAKMLLLYPAVYIFSIVPSSVTRWMQFTGAKMPYQATLFASSIFGLAGVFNVILFWFTRPELVTGGTKASPQEVYQGLPVLQPTASKNPPSSSSSAPQGPENNASEYVFRVQDRGARKRSGTKDGGYDDNESEDYGRLPPALGEEQLEGGDVAGMRLRLLNFS